MNIDKLPSGNYRVRKMVNGKTYTLTLDHKPTEKEVLVLLAEKMAKHGNIMSAKTPFKRACEAYIESKSNILSPSSVRGYKSLVKQISDSLANTSIEKVTKPMVQNEINSYSKGHSSKTISNYYGFIVSVLKYYGNEIHGITLPQKEKKVPYIPTEDEVHAIFNELKDTKYEIPIMLSAMGLRRSEICALTVDDLSKDNTLTIDKAKVQNENNEWVIKSTKTTESTRTIIIPDYIAKKIRQQGYVYDGFPNLLYKHLSDVQTKLGIKHFSLHKMRHFFASYMHNLGYSDKQIQEMGGWKTDGVMKTVYQHAMNMEEAKRQMSANFASLIR